MLLAPKSQFSGETPLDRLVLAVSALYSSACFRQRHGATAGPDTPCTYHQRPLLWGGGGLKRRHTPTDRLFFPSPLPKIRFHAMCTSPRRAALSLVSGVWQPGIVRW